MKILCVLFLGVFWEEKWGSEKVEKKQFFCLTATSDKDIVLVLEE
jgi:hypothetical protein